MTSKERILRTLRREPCDRIPVSAYELVGWNPDSFENREPSYASIMDVIRRETDCLYMTGFDVRLDDSAGACQEVRTWREGESQFTETVFHPPGGVLRQLMRTDDNVMTRWRLEHPLKHIEDIDLYLSIPYRVVGVDVEGVKRAVERLDGRHGIPLISLSDPICLAAELYEFGEFTVLSYTERDRIKYLLDAIHERQMHELRMGLEKLKFLNEVCIFRICGPEYATPPYMSEEYFADFVFPYIKSMTDMIHKYGHFVRIHSHGRVGTALGYFVKAGADATDPVEPPPDGDITLADAKARYGNDLVIFGNIELKLLEAGSTQEVVDYVREMATVGKEGGGFVAMPTAAPINIPLSPKTEQNYLAFFETALEYGRY